MSGIPQDLKDLFSWNPPLLVPEPFPASRTISTKTHEPAFFDKHFTEKLKLLRLKRLPSLAHDIATIVDKTIMDSFNDGVKIPPFDTLLLSALQRNSIVKSYDWSMTNEVHEKAVANFLLRTHSVESRFLTFG